MYIVENSKANRFFFAIEIKGQLLVDITNGFDTKNDSSVGHGTPVQATNIISDGKLCDPNVQQHR